MVPDIFSYNAVLHGYASSAHVKAPERAEKKKSRQLQCLSHNDTTTYKKLLSEWKTKKKNYLK